MSKLTKYKSSVVRRSGCIEIFNSAQEVADKNGTREITNSSFHNMQEPGEVDSSFCGVKDYDEAISLMRTGYQPTVEEMKGALKVRIDGQSKRVSFKNDVIGFQPIVPLALQGVPNCMVNSSMKPIKSKVINICYDSTASWITKSDDIIAAGQKMLSTLIELEMQGYRFNLYAIQIYNDDTTSDILCVKVKSANTPLDLKRISFPLTHTGFFRVIGWDWYSKCPLAKYRRGYGQPIRTHIDDNKKISEMLSEIMNEKVVYFSATGIIKKGKNDIKETITNEKAK